MPDPRSQLVTIPLTLGMDNVSLDEAVQPVGARPRLVSSINTRLSKVPGCVAKAPGCTQLAELTDVTPGGAIPAGIVDSTLVPASSPRRVTGSVAANLTSLVSSVDVQNAYFPAQVERAGIAPGSNTTRFNASVAYWADAHDTGIGWTFFVTTRVLSGSAGGFFLSVVADDGREIVAPTQLVPLSGAPYDADRHVAMVTVHGDNIVFWWGLANSFTIQAATLTVSNTTHAVTLGTPVTIQTLSVIVVDGPYRIQVANDPLDATTAFLVCDHATDAGKFSVLKVTVPSLAVSASYHSAAVFPDRLAIAYRQGVGLIVAASITAAQVNEYEINPSTMALIWSQTAQMDMGSVSVGFETGSGALLRVFAVSRIEAGGDSTYVQWRTDAGALVDEGVLRHQTMVGQIVTVRDAAGDYYALYTTQIVYRPEQPIDSYEPGGDYFVADSSVQVWRMTLQLLPAGGTALIPTPVARLGSDLAIRYPGSLTPFQFGGVTNNTMFIGYSNSCIHVGDERALITYLQENVLDGSVAFGYAVRFAQLDFRALQPRFAFTSDGAAVVAGALTSVWDGSDVTEFGPMFTPRLAGSTTGGSVAFDAGTYQFYAVIMWTDANGQRHRSPPSNVVVLDDAAPFQPRLTVTYTDSCRNRVSQFGYEVVIYASEVDGLTAYAQDWWLTFQVSLAYDSLTQTIDPTAEPIVDAYHPAMYTDGSETQELAAYCPNASLDAAVIADRVWLLDAERPSRWWYSKPKVAGVFAEMSPDLFIETPSSAGRGVALSEWNGNPLFLTERGIWTVSGEGPDALLNPPFFSSAIQVSDVPCTQRNSVVRSPAGVMFVSNNRFARFTGQVAMVTDIDATLYGDVIGTAVFRDQQEVAWFLENGYAYVYNWIADAFTLWDSTVTGLSDVTGCAQRSDGKVVLMGPTEIRLLDPDSVSTTGRIGLSTGWIVLGGPQDNNVVHDLVVHARRMGTHALTVVNSRDYEESTTQSRTWSDAELQLCVGDATTSKRYDVYPQIADQDMRAIKLTLVETGSSGESFQPISVTLDLIKTPGRLRQSMRDAARK